CATWPARCRRGWCWCWPSTTAAPWPARCACAGPTPCTDATGARTCSCPACTSRPATTRVSTTACARACTHSSRVPRENTRSHAASCPRRCAAGTGSPTPGSARRWPTGAPANARPCASTASGSGAAARSARASACRHGTWRTTPCRRHSGARARERRLQWTGEPADPVAGRRSRRPLPRSGRGARAARRTARGGRRPVAHAPAQRLPAGNLPVVLRRPADPVVVPGSAHRLAHRRRAPVPALPPHAAVLALGGARGHRLRTRGRTLRRRPRPGQRGTWITPAMRAAYQRLHALGHAHSVEVYAGPEPDAALVGGVCGVAIGRLFSGESMFGDAAGGSKAALPSLAAWLHARGWPWIDAQVESPHLLALGAETVPRARFLDRVAALAAAPGGPGRWTTAFGARPVRQLAAPG